MSQRTIYLSRLIGLYCILVVGALVIHRQSTMGAMTDIFNTPSVVFTLGAVTVAAGLALVLAHNRWTGGAPTVVVTLVGWLSLLKGMLFLVLPDGVEGEILLKWLSRPSLFYVWLTPSLLIGIYLTYTGFKSKAHS